MDEIDDLGTAIANSKVVHIRLVTGEELVGHCVGKDQANSVYIIKTPMLISDILNPMTQTHGMIMSRYLMYSHDEFVPIRQDHVVCMSVVVPQMEEFYNNSVYYNKEVITKSVVEELERINKTTRTAIASDQQEDEICLDGKNLVLPANNTVN